MKGQRILEIRKALGLTQIEFDNTLGLEEYSISQVEDGSHEITNQLLKRICEQDWNGKYVNDSYLLNGTGEMFMEMSRETALLKWASESLKDEDESFRKEFAHMLSRLSEDKWEDLEQVAKKLFDDKKS